VRCHRLFGIIEESLPPLLKNLLVVLIVDRTTALFLLVHSYSLLFFRLSDGSKLYFQPEDVAFVAVDASIPISSKK
jgi:hypothetical protein